MSTYKIRNYIKLLCIRLDHFETILEDELNTVDEGDIEDFIDRYKDHSGMKILMFDMDTMDMITFNDVRKIIHNAHIFDYVKSLITNGNKLLPIGDINSHAIGSFIKHVLNVD